MATSLKIALGLNIWNEYRHGKNQQNEFIPLWQTNEDFVTRLNFCQLWLVFKGCKSAGMHKNSDLL